MAGEWPTIALKDIAESINTGLDAITRAPIVPYPTAIRCLRIQDVSNNKIYSDWGFTAVRPVDYEKYRLRRGEIIMARTCSTGINYLVRADMEAVFNNGLARIRLHKEVALPEYVYYVFQSQEFINYIDGISGGTSVQLNMKVGDLANFQFPLPPLAEQRAIAGVLGALDDKIELNRRMNATLESMARALFQSWFVDFDPVRAKLDGRPPTGMDKTTADLFPDSFEDSETVHIPKGWRVAVLDELIKFVIGGDWGATAPTDDETVSCYCIRGADIPSLQSGGVGKMPTRFLKRSSVEKRKLEDGDLAIEISGGSPTQSTGRPVLASDALLQSLGRPLVASNFCRIVKLKSSAYSKFVYLWLRRLYDAGELLQFENGTTGIKNFAFVIFSERYLLVVPDLRVFEAFDRAVSPFFARIQANSQESRTLAALRDSLLPKLLSGELSVDHVTAIGSEVL